MQRKKELNGTLRYGMCLFEPVYELQKNLDKPFGTLLS